MFSVVISCRRLQRKKAESVEKKRQRHEDKSGGFARLQGELCILQKQITKWRVKNLEVDQKTRESL